MMAASKDKDTAAAQSTPADQPSEGAEATREAPDNAKTKKVLDNLKAKGLKGGAQRYITIMDVVFQDVE